MHDAPPAAEPGAVDRGGGPRQTGFLTPERIDAILADFRGYLEGLLAPPPAPETVPIPFDLSTVVAQFTALRHDVNLQTKAVRAVAEQAAATPKPVPSPTDSSAPLVKGLIEIGDALATALRQIESVRAGVEPLLGKLSSSSLPQAPGHADPGFFGRLFGGASALNDWAREAVLADAQRTSTAADVTVKLSQLLAGMGDGYTMSLRRVEKALEAAGLVAIPAVGRQFDPELMEAVEVVSGEQSGLVVDEVRRGYTSNGSVVRFALVKVAR